MLFSKNPIQAVDVKNPPKPYAPEQVKKMKAAPSPTRSPANAVTVSPPAPEPPKK